MSKSPNKTQELDLFNSWKSMLEVADLFTKNQIDTIFSLIKRGVTDKMIDLAGRNARLNGYDEKIFDYYAHLMGYYRSAVTLYEENKAVIVTATIKIIIEGIYDILSLQLRQFEDGTAGLEENPVAQEKKAIVNTGVSFFIKSFDDLQKRYMEERLMDMLMDGRALLTERFGYEDALSLTGQLVHEVQESCCSLFYRFFADAVRYCDGKLNDFHSRKTMEFYYNLLDKEREILNSIIKIQADALERVMDRAGSVEEKTLIHNILTSLREGYQYYGREAAEVMASFRQAEAAGHVPMAQSYEDFIAFIAGFTASGQLVPVRVFSGCRDEYEKKQILFRSTLHAEVQRMFERQTGGLTYRKSVYEFRKKMSDHILMANEMVNAFEKLNRHYAQTKDETPDGDAHEIIRGIGETIEIKVESLKENIGVFSEECKEVIIAMAKEKIPIDPKDVDAACDHIMEKWTDAFCGCDFYTEESEREAVGRVKPFLAACEEEEAFAAYRQQRDKVMQSFENKLNKIMLGFLKECILFEVSTFEEIMNYSVSRLRESDDEAVVAYVGLISNTALTIEIILRKNNITVISPHPHEPFNGKEHEVLMAEKNQEYMRGEIIKLMNSGYKHNELVVMRANVIAAK